MKTVIEQKEAQKLIEHELNFSCIGINYEDWLSVLSGKINELLLNDPQKLIFILYRLDINESKLMKLLKDYHHSDAGKVIAELIFERQLQKIKTREHFRKDSNPIDENEKW